MYEPKHVHQALQSGDQQQFNAVHMCRNDRMGSLQQQGIATRPATHAVHMHSYYLGNYQLRPEVFQAAQAVNGCSISLPFFHGMQAEE